MTRIPFGGRRLAAALAGALFLASSVDLSAQAIPTTTPAPRTDEWWVKMHEKFLGERKKAVEDDSCKLLFLGDSITQGWGGNATWQKYYTPRGALNFGIGGDRTEHVLWRIQNGEIEGLHPKAVMLMIGTNNAGSNSADEIAAGVEAIVAELRKSLPDSEILLLGVFPRSEKPDATRAKLQKVNDRIAKLDADPKVHYLDIGKAFLEEDGSISKEIMPDFLHLSAEGYERWAKAVEPTLAKLLGEKS